MRFCFIVEEQYKNEFMPIAVVDQLRKWKHTVDVLEPQTTITSLCDLTELCYDAYILKTVSDGPGLSILEAAEVVGIPTINSSHAVRLVRDKAIAMALAYAHAIPIPQSYFVAHPRLLEQVPPMYYPLVVKPTNGSSGRGIYRVSSPAELATLQITEAASSFLLAQRYVENVGFDIKMYVVGNEVFSVAKRSPLHPDVKVEKQYISTSIELQKLALLVGNIFGLDIYGLDIVETPHGPIVVDINDFPSFGLVPDAVQRIANYVLQIARRTDHHHTTIPLSRQRKRQLMLQDTEPLVPLGEPVRVNASRLSNEIRREYR